MIELVTNKLNPPEKLSFLTIWWPFAMAKRNATIILVENHFFGHL